MRILSWLKGEGVADGSATQRAAQGLVPGGAGTSSAGKELVDVQAAALRSEQAADNPVARKAAAVMPGGADLHKTLPESSPLFTAVAPEHMIGADLARHPAGEPPVKLAAGRMTAAGVVNDPVIPYAEHTLVSWREDRRPMPDQVPAAYEQAVWDPALIFERRGRVLSASPGGKGAGVLLVACEDGELRSVDATAARLESLAASGTRVAWTADYRPMPGDWPHVSKVSDPAWDRSLVVQHRGVLVGSGEGLLSGSEVVVACDDARFRVIDRRKIMIVS